MTTTRHATAANRAAGQVLSPVPRAVLPAVLTAFVGLSAVALLAWPARESIFEGIAGGTADTPWAGLAGLVADKGLLALVAITACLVLFTWLRDRPRFWLLAAAGAGTVAAYAVSEAVKLVVTEERPCRVVDVATVLACPVPGDWSWPSNHSTIAGALTVACLLVAPRLWPAVVPLALVIAGARVAAGVHYMHDVASGLALGVLIACLVGLAVHAVVQRFTRRSTSRRSPAARRTTGR
ncbi:phosphatase PAP2 family protein [Promicromonospora panici]|uniref:phosphatase PAP2 family protein n=1 Tax=Promicromonospora panici TaxID=2219658 RepID=UPI00101DBAA7|nr:phosphatase PAP2 family protein [Promicromonospora panici]